MRSYLITGSRGSGKSAVVAELQRRGYTANNSQQAPTTPNPAHGMVFVAMDVANPQQYFRLFDKVFALVVDVPTLQARLSDDPELPFVSSILERVQSNLQQAGAVIVDGRQPVEAIVTQILSRCDADPSVA